MEMDEKIKPSALILPRPTGAPLILRCALQFLDMLQLRVIFTILIGSLTGIASICIDLNDPFRGSFRITQSATQLYVLRDLMLDELAELCVQQGYDDEVCIAIRAP